MSVLSIEMPRKHRDVLFAEKTPKGLPVRWRGLKGGRDGAKSHSTAKSLLIRGVARPLRIGCGREIQDSIDQSVHKLLCDQINFLGLQDCYKVGAKKIDGVNGTEITYHGVSDIRADSNKSMEGIDIFWIEEAQSLTKTSLNKLVPTIRKPGSEIIATWNPEMEDDAIDERLVKHCPDDAIVAHVNYTDNPWRSKALDSDRVSMLARDPEEFDHVYGGMYRPAVTGAIYFKEVAALKASGRVCNVPYDPMLKAHVICDLGRNDYMAILIVQRLASEIRVVRYIEDRMRDIPSYDVQLRELNYNWGKVWLPHDGRAKTLTSSSNPLGASAEEQFIKLGWQVEIVENIEREQGIRKTREVFPRVYVDKANAGDLVSRLGKYRRNVNSEGQGGEPKHTDDSNGADGFRYTCLVADQLSNEGETRIPNANNYFRRARHG